MDPAKMKEYAKGVEKIKAELEQELRDIIEDDKKPAEGHPVPYEGGRAKYDPNNPYNDPNYSPYYQESKKAALKRIVVEEVIKLELERLGLGKGK